VRRKILCCLTSLLFCGALMAQEIKPQGRFLQDSIRIGEPVPYALSLKYPAKMEVIFPDSAFNFTPFECSKVWYSPTQADSLFRYDSAVYYLSTFEIDSVQYLQLPIYIISGKDSASIFTNTDSLIFKDVITVLPDSLTLYSNTELREVETDINYPLTGLILGGIFILLIFIFLIFGKGIRRRFKAYRIRKTNKKFNREFVKMAYQIGNEPHKEDVVKLMGIWKKYLEKLESNPYTKLSTKEIKLIINDENLHEILVKADKLIYANKYDGTLNFALLRQKANERFEQKIKEVTHG